MNENHTIRDSDGTWQWEATYSWYCMRCIAELGSPRPGCCPQCGSVELDEAEWGNARRTLIDDSVRNKLISRLGAGRDEIIVVPGEHPNSAYVWDRTDTSERYLPGVYTLVESLLVKTPQSAPLPAVVFIDLLTECVFGIDTAENVTVQEVLESLRP